MVAEFRLSQFAGHRLGALATFNLDFIYAGFTLFFDLSDQYITFEYFSERLILLSLLVNQKRSNQPLPIK